MGLLPAQGCFCALLPTRLRLCPVPATASYSVLHSSLFETLTAEGSRCRCSWISLTAWGPPQGNRLQSTTQPFADVRRPASGQAAGGFSRAAEHTPPSTPNPSWRRHAKRMTFSHAGNPNPSRLPPATDGRSRVPQGQPHPPKLLVGPHMHTVSTLPLSQHLIACSHSSYQTLTTETPLWGRCAGGECSFRCGRRGQGDSVPIHASASAGEPSYEISIATLLSRSGPVCVAKLCVGSPV